MIALSSFQPRRPALWTAICFAAGVALARCVVLPLPVLLGVALTLTVGAAAAALWSARAGWLLAGVFVSLGALRYHTATELLPANHILQAGVLGQPGIVRGTVVEEPERGEERTRFVLALAEVETDSARHRVSGRALVTVRDVRMGADFGDRVVLRGRLRRPRPARNPGGFDYAAFLELGRIHAVLSVSRAEQLLEIEDHSGHGLYEDVVLPVRRSIRGSIQQNLRGAPAGLLQGMLLGEKHRIPAETRDSFRRTGLAHALVISGLHVGLITVFFFTGFKLCRMPERWTAAATIAVLALYALVTELQPPVVRASIMAGAILLGRLARRSGDIYNSLGLAALIILAAQPTSLASLSFQLSFGATAAIVALHGPISRLFPAAWQREDGWVGRWLVSPLCVSLAAQMGTAPLIALHFQQIAPIGPLANLVVVPLLGLAVALGLLSALTGWCLPLAATVFNASNYAVIRLLLWLVEALNSLPFGVVQVPRPGWGFVLGALLLAGLLAWLPASRRAWKAGLFGLLIWVDVALWTNVLRERQLEVVFLDVGQGDTAFLRFPNGRTMVVDGGARSDRFDCGARVLLPFLRHWGAGRIDVVVVSHLHNDHSGGLVALLEEVEVGHYLDSGQQYESFTARRLRSLIEEKGIDYHRVAAGDSLVGLGGVGGLVLHPTPEFVGPEAASQHHLNDGSVVLRLEYGDVSLLFTGDIEEGTDAAMLGWGGRLQSTILKVPHHGSSTSSGPSLVAAVAPRTAVVSVGEFSKFDHPSPAVMARFEEQGIEVLRTDRCGAVMLHTDGTRVGLRTMVADCAGGK